MLVYASVKSETRLIKSQLNANQDECAAIDSSHRRIQSNAAFKAQNKRRPKIYSIH